MNKTEATKSEAIGLDIGTSRIVTARQNKNEFRYDSQLNAFVAIPYSKMTANVLKQEAVPHAVTGTRSWCTGTNPSGSRIFSTRMCGGRWRGAC